jgi:hypothetical protein
LAIFFKGGKTIDYFPGPWKKINYFPGVELKASHCFQDFGKWWNELMGYFYIGGGRGSDKFDGLERNE